VNSRFSTTLLALCLAAAYFYVLGILKLPYAEVPTGWLSHSPSRHIGVVTWLELLDVAGALIAALPVALVLTWRLSPNYLRWAFVVAAPAALYSVIGLGSTFIAEPRRADVLLVAVVAAVARLLAVPALAIAASRLLPQLRLTKVGAGRYG
jgi:hypothetical protein